MVSAAGAPAERNVSDNGTQVGFPFRSAGARKNFLELARSINITSLRDGGTESQNNLVKKTRNQTFVLKRS